MDKAFSNIEDLFQQSYKDHKEEVNSNVLRSIKRKLWWSDFFSLNFRKLNVVYVTLAVAAISTTPLLKNHDSSTSNSDIALVEKLATTESVVSDNVNNENEKEENVILLSDNSDLNDALETVEEVHGTALFDISANKGCSPFNVQFSNKSLHAKSFLWDFGTGETSSSFSPEYTFTQPGQYKIKLTITDENGNTNVKIKDITVLASPKADLSIDIANSKIERKAILFKNLSSNAVSYKWQFGDKSMSEEKQPVHSYNDFGIYNVKLICTAENGCVDTAVLVNKFIEKNYALAFPMTFQPNPTNTNNQGYYESANAQGSVFYPENYGAKSYDLEIYTGNGIKVFSTQDIKQGWNGFIRGRIAPAGIYKYIAKGVYPNDQSFQISGSFKVIVTDYYNY